MDFIATKWPRLFMLTATVQAVLCLSFEAFVFAKFQGDLIPDRRVEPSNGSQFKSVPTFLTLFIFAFIYELVLVWDALRMKNTIQVIGICVSNLAVLVYTTIQTDQISGAIETLKRTNALKVVSDLEPSLWDTIRPFLIAIPILIGVSTVIMSCIAWKLYQEFAWDILKQIGADYRMKKRFLHYQIYIALLKFDFFFFLGFTIQFVVIVTGVTSVELGLTSAAIPVTIIILLCAAFFTRREIKSGMIIIIILYLCALAYFFFKLVRIYQPGFRDHYVAVQKSLTAFSVITILLIILTITNAFVCMHNFNKGLKAHILRKDSDVEKHQDAQSIGLSDVKPQLPSRMTID